MLILVDQPRLKLGNLFRRQPFIRRHIAEVDEHPEGMGL